MYLYYRKCHCTHVLLEEENKKLIDDWEKLIDVKVLSYLQKLQDRLKKKQEIIKLKMEKPQFGIAVDGWCKGNPGPCGYIGVDIETGEVLFCNNNLGIGTNNIAEYVGICHAVGFAKINSKYSRIFSDSEIAIKWIKMKGCNTDFNTSKNPELAHKIWKCDMMLLEKKREIIIDKWQTNEWGQIPSDAGNKIST